MSKNPGPEMYVQRFNRKIKALTIISTDAQKTFFEDSKRTVFLGQESFGLMVTEWSNKSKNACPKITDLFFGMFYCSW